MCLGVSRSFATFTYCRWVLATTAVAFRKSRSVFSKSDILIFSDMSTKTQTSKSVEASAPVTINQEQIGMLLKVTDEMAQAIIKGGLIDKATLSAYKLAVMHRDTTAKHKTYCEAVTASWSDNATVLQMVDAVQKGIKVYTEDDNFHSIITIDISASKYSIHCGSSKVRSTGTKSNTSDGNSGQYDITIGTDKFTSWSAVLKSINAHANGNSAYRVCMMYFNPAGGTWKDTDANGDKLYSAKSGNKDIAYDLMRNDVSLKDKHTA